MATPADTRIAPHSGGDKVRPRTSALDDRLRAHRAAEKAEARRRRLPLLPALLFVIVCTQVPFLLTIWYSLRSRNLLRPEGDQFVGLRNFADLFVDSTFRTAAMNSVLITLGCVFVSVLLGLGLALLLDRRFVGRGLVRTLLITPFLIMPVAGAMLWSISMFNPSYGLVNWLIGLVGISPVDWTSQFPVFSIIVALVWQWTPFMMLLLLAGLQSQSKDVLEAASIDGAGAWKTFLFVTLPHLRFYLELSVLLGAIYVVNTFDHIYLMTAGGPGTASANLPFYIYQRAFLGFDIGQSAAMGVVTVIATIVIAMFALRLIFRSINSKEQS
ncbi:MULTISPECIES: carbohydrate ABC transporter permease [Nesterenkonia]|uniref:Sorbitol/mannitol transport system permease protein n=1 Tax=Nesterenkonia xinjiangensis TaxID=225327 RepID=A0A7Z0GND9_9MICC|nr:MULTISPECIES: sugar ABC transporter permease [Nesterenkonia]MDZ5078284.1 sugar ABC transporter permease [Nesterenkonia sp. HG001]NYJ78103.1 sorbitol/mannitol transport system permease protein [Nesterenkonia xinjiangensis]